MKRAMIAMCKGRNVIYDEWPDFVVDGKSVKTLKQRKGSFRDACHATEVFLL